VARTDLPRELASRPLTYGELIETLALIDGEPVIVRLNAVNDTDQPPAGLASIVGELHQVPARYPGREFSIGTPYPDHDCGTLGGGVLFLDEPTFQGAALSTHDGNDYFVIGITTRSAKIVLQGVDSTYP
jgi:hypothetical protein